MEPKFCTLGGRGIKIKSILNRRSMVFLLKSWSGDPNLYINLRGDENSIKYIIMSSTLSPQVINASSLSVVQFYNISAAASLAVVKLLQCYRFVLSDFTLLYILFALLQWKCYYVTRPVMVSHHSHIIYMISYICYMR